MKKIISLLLALVLMVPFFAISSNAEEYAREMPEMKEHGFITARDGAKIEYAIYGDLSAEPLVMLPCNGNDMHNLTEHFFPKWQSISK